MVCFLRRGVRFIVHIDQGSYMRRSTIIGKLLLPRAAVIIVTAAIAATAGCGSDSSTATTPTPATTTETFAGTVDHLGTAGHAFTVGTTGPVTITLTAVGPLTTMSMGIGIGTWDGTTCYASSTKNDNARTGVTALTGTANAGSYCVNVFDSGNVPEEWQVSYEVQVVHP